MGPDDKPWTDADTDFLRANHRALSYGQIAKLLDRTRSAVCGKAKRLGLPTLTPTEAAANRTHRHAEVRRSQKPRVGNASFRPSHLPSNVERLLAPPKPKVDPASPAALAAQALLARARAAEARREGYRERGVR